MTKEESIYKISEKYLKASLRRKEVSKNLREVKSNNNQKRRIVEEYHI